MGSHCRLVWIAMIAAGLAALGIGGGLLVRRGRAAPKRRWPLPRRGRKRSRLPWR